MGIARTLLAGAVAGALAGGTSAARPPAAAGAAGQDAARWRALVQMPVAVARLELAGVSRPDLRRMIPAFNTAEVEPHDFLEAARAIPVLWGADYDPADDYDPPAADTRDTEGGGEPDEETAYVQSLVGRGLRGAALVAAVREEMARRGVPERPQGSGGTAAVLHPDFIPDELVDGRFRDDPFFRSAPRTDDGAAAAGRSGSRQGPPLFGGEGPSAGAGGGAESDAGTGPPAVRTDTTGDRSRGGTVGTRGLSPAAEAGR